MAAFFSQIELAEPSYLWLLVLLPLLWIRLRRGAVLAILWRSALFCLLVLALAEPAWVEQRRTAREPKRPERVVAFDLSRSIPEAMRLWMAEKAKKDLAIGPGDRVFLFAREAREVKDWESRLRDPSAGDQPGPERTDLEALFSALLRLPRAPRELYLFTDGWENQGSVARLFLSLPQSALKVFPILPAGPLPVANVAVRKVVAPHQGTSGEGVELKAIVDNRGATELEGTLVLSGNGETLAERTVRVRPGSQIYAFRAVLREGPLAAFRLSFRPRSAALDLFSEDNEATAWVAVRSKEKVLLLGSSAADNRYLEEILKRRGFEVTSLGRDGVAPPPGQYAAVIFNDAGKELFSPAYLDSIERHVAAGSGFAMLGGEGSFGPGYRRTPVERILPVELKEPKKIPEKTRAVVLIIDKSGSMREEDKLLYAKEAAKAMARQLAEHDLLGVVGFDIAPFVVVPLEALGQNRPGLDAEIDRLKPGGKTYLLPAIVEARRQLERQAASRKHVIILSDGETGGSGGEYIDLVAAMKEELKITISAVAIGDRANIPLLKRIAQYGGGLFHHTYDPRTLPQIVLEEIREKPQPIPSVEKDFVPAPSRDSEILSGFAPRSYPAVKGFVDTDLKQGAKLDLAVPRDQGAAPLLASWRFGKGRAAAFTTDLSGRWSKEWIGWEGLERFWGRVLEWLIPPAETLPPHVVRVNPEGDRTVLDFFIYEEKTGGGRFLYSYTGQAVRGEGALKRLAPGRYQAELPVRAPGDYRIEIVEQRAGQKVVYPPVGYTLAFAPKEELPSRTINLPLLEELARLSGGEINPEPKERVAQIDLLSSARPYRTELIFFIFALLLIEFISRRLLAARRGT